MRGRTSSVYSSNLYSVHLWLLWLIIRYRMLLIRMARYLTSVLQSDSQPSSRNLFLNSSLEKRIPCVLLGALIDEVQVLHNYMHIYAHMILFIFLDLINPANSTIYRIFCLWLMHITELRLSDISYDEQYIIFNHNVLAY